MMAMPSRPRELLLEHFQLPKPARCGLAFAAVCWFLAFALSVAALLFCGQNQLENTKGQWLHVVGSLKALLSAQKSRDLDCDADCQHAVGQEVQVQKVWYQKLLVYHGGTPPKGSELELAGSAFQEMWCSTDDTWAAALVVAILLGICGLILGPILTLHQWIRERNFIEMQRELDGGQCQVYSMALAGATWQYFAAAEWIQNSRAAWQFFPCADLLVPSVNWVISIVVVGNGFTWESVAPGAIILLLTLAVRIAFRILASLRFRKRLAKRRAELYVCAAPRANLVGMVCDGHAYFYQNIGDFPQQVPRGLRWKSSSSMALARTQLIAVKEASTEEGGAISWYLKVIYGLGGQQQGTRAWHVESQLFPVDNARVHDFQNWLADPERRQLFRCVGATATQRNVLAATPAALLTPFQIPDGEMHTPLSAHNKVFTAQVQKVEDSLYKVSLMSMSGEEAESFTFRKGDTLADVLYRVASRPQFRAYQVKIFLSDGTQLDTLDARMALHELFIRAQASTSA